MFRDRQQSQAFVLNNSWVVAVWLHRKRGSDPDIRGGGDGALQSRHERGIQPLDLQPGGAPATPAREFQQHYNPGFSPLVTSS